jgi:hypothetical protein
VDKNTYLKVIVALAILALALAFSQTGCAPQKGTTIPSYEEAKAQVLKAGPLIDKPTEERNNFPKGKAAPVKAGEAAPFSGVLLDDKQAARLAAIKAERDKLRAIVEAERLQQRTKDIINDKALKALSERAKRTWWEKHKGEILLGVGGTLGIGLVLGVLYALTKGDGASSSTNAHILSRP